MSEVAKTIKGNYKGNNFEITKQYRTRTQYEWFLKIFMGESDYESVALYTVCHLTKKAALKELEKASNRKIRIVKTK